MAPVLQVECDGPCRFLTVFFFLLSDRRIGTAAISLDQPQHAPPLHMIAICHRCGSVKQNPIHSCPGCDSAPQTDEDITLSFMLTDSFLEKEKLIKAAKTIRSGQRIQLPPSVRAAVLASLKEARAQQPPQQQGISAKGWKIIAAIAAVLLLIFHPWPHFQRASFRDRVSGYESFVSRFPSSDYASGATACPELFGAAGIGGE